MLSGASDAETCGNLIKKVWYNAIYEESDSKTDKYTKPNGYFVSDFNDALQNLFSDSSFSSQIADINSNKDTVNSLMKKLKNPPEEYKDAYEVLSKLYDAYISLTNLATDPTGSLQTFSRNFNDADNETLNCYNALSMQDATDFDSGTTSQNDADAFVDGMDNSDINGAFTGEGSAVNDFGDYPVEEEEAGMEESSEPDMELEGNAIGSAGGDDIGIGSGMDTSGGETALSGGNPSSGEQASVQSGGIISEISGNAGMKLSDSSETSGGVYASDEGESSYTAGGQGYTSEGRSPHTDFSSARENGKYESEGYHDFDGLMYQNTSTNMGPNQGIHAEELKKREQGIGSESGEIREVPKTREEFRKKNQRNHSHSEDHFLT